MFNRKRLIAVCGIIIAAAIVFYNFLSRHYVVPVLMYHSVNWQPNPSNRLAVTPVTFERQMHFLKSHRYNVIPLSSLVELIRNNQKIPRKTIVITFDDGYKDNYVYAFPILKKYNLPATIFIIIQEVDRPQNDRLNWQEIQSMQDSRIIDFGSHALGPEPLVNIQSEPELKRQIFEPKKILLEKLGRPVELFSYPGGMFNPKIKQLVIEAGYRGAVATNPGEGSADCDVFALKRLRISENAANMFVFYIESSGYYTFFKEQKKRRHEKR